MGLLISLGSYAAAASSSTGGGYVIAWGAVLFGGINTLRVAMALRQVKRYGL